MIRPMRLGVMGFFWLMMTLVALPASAQTCRAADDSSFDMIAMVRDYATATDSPARAARDSLRIPSVTDSASVVLVSKESTCRSANTAYQKAATGDRFTLSGRVYVVQVGASYVVWDPAYRFQAASPADIYMVFNSKWTLQSIF